ncbi:hypothetical protein CY34DRAFT_806946 [Suillus luteus UH-Slu-Lm8-n1]|uniref:Uncharacterized protein n=1 Tax=Suillus luteus UH-Slu-Lm8-n1 TaxID=930992 RepID=A0A0D0AG14_9AGAM|nr:hypothetical protein CY34DRAFT_806946 [Suillus luteus UH-Slu-Lm8-n1]
MDKLVVLLRMCKALTKTNTLLPTDFKSPSESLAQSTWFPVQDVFEQLESRV